MFKCDIIFLERRRGRVVETLEKSSGMLQNFWDRSPSRQFIFNALS